MKLPNEVVFKEVGPRDGLQNEKGMVSTAEKVGWINLLSETGVSHIEVSSFVHPKWIPALADADDVFQRITRKPNVTYSALAPNLKGLERALAVNVDELAVFMSASETHNRKNINKSIEETYPVLQEVIERGKASGKKVRGYLSTVFGCPYEGDVDSNQVQRICEKLLEMGVYEISLGDTIGIANPQQVDTVLKKLLQTIDADKLALHFHETRGMALANSLAGITLGINTLDGSLGGLGGCPYAKGATGNVASEDMIFMLEEMGIATGIDVQAYIQAADYIEKVLGKSLPSHQLNIAKGGLTDGSRSSSHR